MPRRLGLVFGVVVAATIALGGGSQAVGANLPGATAGSIRAAAGAVPMFGAWGPVRTLAFPTTSLNVQVNSMACPVPGDCVVGGSEANGVIELWPFLVAETKGAWRPVSLLSPHNVGNSYAGINSVSCAAAGDCAAAGYAMASVNSKVDRGILVAERNGAWDKPQVVSGIRYGAVSCAGAGCVAGGSQDSVTGETGGGVWGTPRTLTGSGAVGGSVLAVSCPAAGDCAAVGGYGTGTAPPAERAFTADLTGGLWGALTDVLVTTTGNRELNVVSCRAAGDCEAIGYYVDALDNRHVLDVTERGGSWNAPVTVPAFEKLPGATVTTLSCPTAMFCAAGGEYEPVPGGNQIPFVASEVNGTWSAERVPGLPVAAKFTYGGIEVTSVSCPKAGYCLAGGSYLKPVSGGVQIQGFLDSDVNGIWAPMQPVPGLAARNHGSFAGVSAVSCPTVSFCGAAGFYTSPTTGFVMNGSIVPAATGTSLELSTARIRYGHEQLERITVRVSAAGAAAIPGGKVTVRAGSAVVCVITLSGGKGGCRLTAKRLGAGSYTVTASYPRTLGFLGSAAPAKHLTIRR